MLEVWRITTSRLAQTAFDGEGAHVYGGRWNASGSPMVYTAAHLSLAVLEMLVQDHPLRANYLAIPAQIPEGVTIKRLSVRQLPRDWRESSGVATLRVVGTDWLNANETAVLEAPSAMLPEELIYLLNPRHPDFRRIAVGAPRLALNLVW